MLAASVLVAIVAVLVGFHAVTMVLGARTLSGEAERNAKPRQAPPRIEVAVPAAKPVEASPAVPVTAAAAVAAEPTNAEPLGIAAAAKAKAQAELDALADDPPEPARRPARVPRVELHKVY